MVIEGVAGQNAWRGRVPLSCGRELDACILGGEGGGPVALFDAGAFGIYADGIHIGRCLSMRGVRTILYTRAGLHRSDALPQDAIPDPAFHAADMAALLDALGVGRKVVMLAHSMAGLRARAFAHYYRERLAGIAFLDAVTPAQLSWPIRRSLARGGLWAVGRAAPLATTPLGRALLALYPNLIALNGAERAAKDDSLRDPVHLAGTAAECLAATDPSRADVLRARLSCPALAVTSTQISRGTRQETEIRPHHWRGAGHARLLSPVWAEKIAALVVEELVEQTAVRDVVPG